MVKNPCRISALAALCLQKIRGWWKVVLEGRGGQLDADGTPWTRLTADDLLEQLQREAHTQCHVRTVRRALKELADCGLVQRRQRYAYRWRRDWWYAPPAVEVEVEVIPDDLPAALNEEAPDPQALTALEAAETPEVPAEPAAEAPAEHATTEWTPVSIRREPSCPIAGTLTSDRGEHPCPVERTPMSVELLKTPFSCSDLSEDGDGEQSNSHKASRLDGGKGFGGGRLGSIAQRLQEAVQRAQARGRSPSPRLSRPRPRRAVQRPEHPSSP